MTSEPTFFSNWMRFSFFNKTKSNLYTHKAGLFGVLEIVAMAFSDLAIDGFLDPHDLVDQFVAPLFHKRAGIRVLSIDDPG